MGFYLTHVDFMVQITLFRIELSSFGPSFCGLLGGGGGYGPGQAHIKGLCGSVCRSFPVSLSIILNWIFVDPSGHDWCLLIQQIRQLPSDVMTSFMTSPGLFGPIMMVFDICILHGRPILWPSCQGGCLLSQQLGPFPNDVMTSSMTSWRYQEIPDLLMQVYDINKPRNNPFCSPSSQIKQHAPHQESMSSAWKNSQKRQVVKWCRHLGWTTCQFILW